MTAASLFASVDLDDACAFEGADILGIASDSRVDQAGALFVCMPSVHRDTHNYAFEAIENGAVAAIANSDEGFARLQHAGVSVGLIRISDSFNRRIAKVTKTVLGDPSSSMRIVGITGTNGKTTTAWILYDALTALGERVAYLGTLGIKTPLGLRTLENTTPFPVELWNLIKEARDAGCTTLVMEVSSHGLQEDRISAVPFDVGVFTNLSQDHLDYHANMDEYAEAKLRLFTSVAESSGRSFVAILNADDPVGRDWAECLKVPVKTFGFEHGMLRGTADKVGLDSLTLGFGSVSTTMRLGGWFNAKNALAAMATLVGMGYPRETAAIALQSATSVPGRFEAVPNETGIGVLVDYAHTPDALEKLLFSARELNPKRLIGVFGCGGDRDKTKRPQMARVASTLADLTIVTSDNPRNEDPATIIDDICIGLAPDKPYETVIDRREAIFRAITLAQPGDTVVIAGKGHENYQIIGRTKYPMDDREIALDALAARLPR